MGLVVVLAPGEGRTSPLTAFSGVLPQLQDSQQLPVTDILTRYQIQPGLALTLRSLTLSLQSAPDLQLQILIMSVARQHSSLDKISTVTKRSYMSSPDFIN